MRSLPSEDPASGSLAFQHFNNIYVIFSWALIVIAIQEYFDRDGWSRFRAWFNELDTAAAAKTTTALERLGQGNKSALKSVGKGVSEYKIDFGPGYRIYFGNDGDRLVILLGGGEKKRQNHDIANAHAAWREYKQRKKESLQVGPPKAASKVATSKNQKQK